MRDLGIVGDFTTQTGDFTGTSIIYGAKGDGGRGGYGGRGGGRFRGVGGGGGGIGKK